jgi:FixJ family two-component response regulator
MCSSRNISVAIVDDDESLRRSLARLLRAAGFQPVTYLSAEALLADDDRPHFDCLMLDIQLGGMSGIELSERLAASGSTTPVIFITAHDDPEMQARAVEASCAAYLRKTEPAQSVLAAIHAAVNRNVTSGQ